MSDRDEMTDNVKDEMIPLTLPRTKTVKFCELWDAASEFEEELEEALLCFHLQSDVCPTEGAVELLHLSQVTSVCAEEKRESIAHRHTHEQQFGFLLYPSSLTVCFQRCGHHGGAQLCTDTESADLPAAATVFPAFEKMTRELCIRAQRCKSANCSRYTWKCSTFRRRSHPGRWG